MKVELSRSVEIATSIMLLATEANPPSPEGYCIGLVVGRMLSQGFTHDEIRTTVSHAIDVTLARGERADVVAGPSGGGVIAYGRDPEAAN